MAGRYPLPAQPKPFYAVGLWDALDGTTAPDGAAFILQNLVHDITTPRIWGPRPAATPLTTGFAGFSSPGVVSVLFAAGTVVYGLVKSARNAGKDEPFAFDTVGLNFLTVGNITNPNTPTTQPTTGAWTPPTMAQIGNKIMVTHPGFAGSSNVVGWFDIGGASITLTADEHTSTTLDNFNGTSADPLTLGLQVGYLITGAGIPANTYIVSITATQVIMSKAATAGTGGVSIVFSGGTETAPLWGAGQTNTVNLPGVPVAVAQFSGRAWYAYLNELWFSDALLPLQITNATQALFLGDVTQPFVAFGGLPLQTTTGGIVQSLCAFKGTGSGGYFQITGDVTTSNLMAQGPIGNVGCAGPRTVQQTPAGILFMALDGIRIVLQSGVVSTAPVPGVRQPFASAEVPSRACACYNDTVYRISLFAITDPIINPVVPTPTFVDYWYDFEINQWSGPHTCAYDACVAVGDNFVFASNENPAELYLSAVSPGSASLYVEFGVQLQCQLQSAILPDTGTMAVKSVIESTLDLTLLSGAPPVTVFMIDESFGIIDQAIIQPNLPGTIWNSFQWGGALWAGQEYGLRSYNCDWSAPIVYKKANVQVNVSAFAGLRIGAFWQRIEDLQYMNIQNPA